MSHNQSALGEILLCAIVILGILGVLYMLKDVFTAMVLLIICGMLIFARAYVTEKLGW